MNIRLALFSPCSKMMALDLVVHFAKLLNATGMLKVCKIPYSGAILRKFGEVRNEEVQICSRRCPGQCGHNHVQTAGRKYAAYRGSDAYGYFC